MAHPKKSLGQNFLNNAKISQRIIQSCDLSLSDEVLEIGPGRGALTRQLAPLVKRIIAVEIDRRLCEQLRQELKFNNLEIVCQDILRFDFSKVASKLKVIGNIPYYISTPIISHLLGNKGKIDAIYLSLQKELGLRAAALPGGKEYGAFSCFVQHHTEPEILFPISKGCFSPQPKVDSVFVRLRVRPQPLIKVKDEEYFFKIIHAAFSQRRKTLGNALSALLPKKELLTGLKALGIDPGLRAEKLTLGDFARIADYFLLRKVDFCVGE
ncbi:MAG: 16S rRNA (adenine(1518)-N(6)/adenine(1519)-N(6))-dimethyltransferase RsmA [Candidatus Omnitrophota bacterium]